MHFRVGAGSNQIQLVNNKPLQNLFQPLGPSSGLKHVSTHRCYEEKLCVCVHRQQDNTQNHQASYQLGELTYVFTYLCIYLCIRFSYLLDFFLSLFSICFFGSDEYTVCIINVPRLIRSRGHYDA